MWMYSRQMRVGLQPKPIQLPVCPRGGARRSRVPSVASEEASPSPSPAPSLSSNDADDAWFYSEKGQRAFVESMDLPGELPTILREMGEPIIVHIVMHTPMCSAMGTPLLWLQLCALMGVVAKLSQHSQAPPRPQASKQASTHKSASMLPQG